MLRMSGFHVLIQDSISICFSIWLTPNYDEVSRRLEM